MPNNKTREGTVAPLANMISSSISMPQVCVSVCQCLYWAVWHPQIRATSGTRSTLLYWLAIVKAIGGVSIDKRDRSRQLSTRSRNIERSARRSLYDTKKPQSRSQNEAGAFTPAGEKAGLHPHSALCKDLRSLHVLHQTLKARERVASRGTETTPDGSRFLHPLSSPKLLTNKGNTKCCLLTIPRLLLTVSMMRTRS
jgi:hypothetical protein